jgi:hypothetical protein
MAVQCILLVFGRGAYRRADEIPGMAPAPPFDRLRQLIRCADADFDARIQAMFNPCIGGSRAVVGMALRCMHRGQAVNHDRIAQFAWKQTHATHVNQPAGCANTSVRISRVSSMLFAGSPVLANRRAVALLSYARGTCEHLDVSYLRIQQDASRISREPRS